MNFSDLGKMKEMMEAAKNAQGQLERKLSETVIDVETGGGMVHVRMNGRKELLRLKIEPTAMGANSSDIELLEDLITSAINEAGRRVDEAVKDSMSGILGGLTPPNIPGLTE